MGRPHVLSATRVIEDFISRWSAASPSERANAQLFPVELCDPLGVPRPDPKPGSGYASGFPVTEHHPDGSLLLGTVLSPKTDHHITEMAAANVSESSPVWAWVRLPM